jgi:hypothetical protein
VSDHPQQSARQRAPARPRTHPCLCNILHVEQTPDNVPKTARASQHSPCTAHQAQGSRGAIQPRMHTSTHLQLQLLLQQCLSCPSHLLLLTGGVCGMQQHVRQRCLLELLQAGCCGNVLQTTLATCNRAVCEVCTRTAAAAAVVRNTDKFGLGAQDCTTVTAELDSPLQMLCRALRHHTHGAMQCAHAPAMQHIQQPPLLLLLLLLCGTASPASSCATMLL